MKRTGIYAFLFGTLLFMIAPTMSGELSYLGDCDCDNDAAACEADCDNDSDCADGLLCFQRGNGGTDPVPGCTGSFDGGWDYCYDPVQPVGELWASSNDGGGAECEGDCDDDSDCSGDLLCFQRDEGDTDPVPGCSGSFWADFDYCYNPTEPTETPSVPPTEPLCPEDEMYAVNWHDLLNDDDVSTDDLLYDSSIEFDAASLSLTFFASLEYVGLSADGNFDHENNLGTTYWIDFQTFDSDINKPGSCGNREAEDYDDLDFADYWTYPTNPDDLATASDGERMAYPPSDWNITAENCNEVTYERTFSWTDLTACSDAADSALIQVTQTNETVTLSGTFYVELVSPYTMTTSDYYRSTFVVQQEFGIVLMRQVNVLASTGVQLFISSVIGYGRAADGGNYSVIILTQSAEYVELEMNDGVNAISGPDNVKILDIEAVNPTCLVASSFTCGQIFTMTVAADCSADDNQSDLSGDYQFGFTPQCRVDDDGNTDDACDTFIDSLDGNDVVLDVESTFVDDCDGSYFDVSFEGELDFYSDAAFTEPVTTDSDPFVIGQDTIYGKVTVNTAEDPDGAIYEFVDVSIEAVYVCTANPDDDDLTVNSDSGIGGCFSESIDADGPYNVIGTGAFEGYEGVALDAAGNEATFSFLTFDTPRTTIYVHVQLLMTLQTESGVRRRRMLLQSFSDGDDGNAFKSYIGTASVQEAETTIAPLETDGAAAIPVFLPALFVFIAGIFV